MSTSSPPAPTAGSDIAPPRAFGMSMRIKLLIAFAGSFTVIFAAVSVWVVHFATTTTLTRLQNQLMATAIGGAETVGARDFEAMVASVKAVPDPTNEFGLGYPDSPLYTQQCERLLALRTIVPEASPYSYFRDPVDGRLYFAASYGALVDPPFGVTYRVPVSEVVSPYTYDLMDRGLSQRTLQEPYTDAFGSWISAYVPIKKADGTVVGAVGVDYPLTYVDEVESRVRLQILPVIVISYLVLIALVLLLSTSLTRPIKRLNDATRRIAEGEYDLDLSAVTRTRFPDEMSTLARSFSIMASKVAARERSLTQQVQRLRVEIDEAKRRKSVAEITDTDFFADLSTKAAEMRKRVKEPGDDTTGG